MRLPLGFTASAVAASIKPSGGLDVGLLVSDRSAVATGVFTTNRVKAAPVLLSQRHLRRGVARAIVMNAGNANACTGKQGIADARGMAAEAAKATGLRERDILVASTGVIGVLMPMEQTLKGIVAASEGLSADGLSDVARAIMTTDTKPKFASASVGGATIAGIAKGAGMIAPEMATMLSFISTDAVVDRGVLQSALQRAMARSFNAISVDGCMSTNDTVIVLANGAAGGEPLTGDSADDFARALQDVCSSLARQIVEDGEGATKVVTITVRGATSEREAARAASSIGSSVLLRCALTGADPNWGRVLAALGTSGIAFDPNTVDVWLGGEHLCARGAPGPGNRARAQERMREREVEIVVDMARGTATSSLLTNDLSAEYVRINSEYTT